MGRIKQVLSTVTAAAVIVAGSSAFGIYPSARVVEAGSSNIFTSANLVSVAYGDKTFLGLPESELEQSASYYNEAAGFTVTAGDCLKVGKTTTLADASTSISYTLAEVDGAGQINVNIFATGAFSGSSKNSSITFNFVGQGGNVIANTEDVVDIIIANRYTLTVKDIYKDHAGSTTLNTVVRTTDVKAPDAAYSYSSLSPEGYTLTGDATKAGSAIGNADIEFVYLRNEYTANFKDYDGTILKTQAVEHGLTATPPADPTRSGYTFTGWSANPSTPVTGNVDYVATYTVNGGGSSGGGGTGGGGSQGGGGGSSSGGGGSSSGGSGTSAVGSSSGGGTSNGGNSSGSGTTSGGGAGDSADGSTVSQENPGSTQTASGNAVSGTPDENGAYHDDKGNVISNGVVTDTQTGEIYVTDSAGKPVTTSDGNGQVITTSDGTKVVVTGDGHMARSEIIIITVPGGAGGAADGQGSGDAAQRAVLSDESGMQVVPEAYEMPTGDTAAGAIYEVTIDGKVVKVFVGADGFVLADTGFIYQGKTYVADKNGVISKVDKIKGVKVKNLRGKKVKITFKKKKIAVKYQIESSYNKDFSGKKSKLTTKKRSIIAGATPGKILYVRVRYYAKAGGKKYYSKWVVKKIKVDKK